MVSAGRILIMPKGDWSALTSYDMLDLVSLNGIAYLARQASVGQNPATDASMTYWQPFGSASSIATPSSPGLVMPDDESIKIDGTGKINVNIDNSTLVYDSTNDYLKAVISTALSSLTDVNVTSAQNGQALIYDSTSQKWENTTLYGTGIPLSSTDATTVKSAVDNLRASDASLTAQIVATQNDLNHTNVVTGFEVDLTGWTSDTSSQSGTTLYKKQITLNHVYVESPTIDIGSSGVLPTVSEQESYNLLQYVTVDDSVPCLYLYASAIPTSAFYISVKGVD